MSPEDRDAFTKFRSILRDAIRTRYQRQGYADLDDVCTEMERTSSRKLKRLAPRFGRQYMRILAQHELKRRDMKTNGRHRTTSQKHRCTNAPITTVEQSELDFADIDQWRGIPPSVTLEDRPGHVIYMPWEDLIRWQRHACLC